MEFNNIWQQCISEHNSVSYVSRLIRPRCTGGIPVSQLHCLVWLFNWYSRCIRSNPAIDYITHGCTRNRDVCTCHRIGLYNKANACIYIYIEPPEGFHLYLPTVYLNIIGCHMYVYPGSYTSPSSGPIIPIIPIMFRLFSKCPIISYILGKIPIIPIYFLGKQKVAFSLVKIELFC